MGYEGETGYDFLLGVLKRLNPAEGPDEMRLSTVPWPTQNTVMPFVSLARKSKSMNIVNAIETRERTISGEIVGCACWLQRGPFFNDIFTTNISVYFI